MSVRAEQLARQIRDAEQRRDDCQRALDDAQREHDRLRDLRDELERGETPLQAGLIRPLSGD